MGGMSRGRPSPPFGALRSDSVFVDPIDDLNHGTMGERTLGGSDHVWVSAIREKIAHDIATAR